MFYSFHSFLLLSPSLAYITYIALVLSLHSRNSYRTLKASSGAVLYFRDSTTAAAPKQTMTLTLVTQRNRVGLLYGETHKHTSSLNYQKQNLQYNSTKHSTRLIIFNLQDTSILILFGQSTGVISNSLIYNLWTQQDDCWMNMNSCLATQTLDRFCASQIQPSFWPTVSAVWVQRSIKLTYTLKQLLKKKETQVEKMEA